VAARSWMPVDHSDVCVRRSVRAPGGAAVGAGAPLPVGLVDAGMAAKGGHLEVLQWARENDAIGEVWNEDTVRSCAGGPMKQEVLTWLDELSAP